MYTYVNGLGSHLAALEGLRRQFDSVFNNHGALGELPVRGGVPSTVVDSGDAWVLSADLPGLGHEDIHLSVTARGFVLDAVRRPVVPEGFQARRAERTALPLQRKAQFPTDIDPDGVTAELKDGILTVTFPKVAKARARRIDVTAG